ncbi:hypothetical protein MJH12_03935, partial [bacterium]|nr:hypothetical protein [bacterium]
LFPAFALFVLVFPLLGFFCICFGQRKSWKALKLLKYGILAEGALVKKEATGSEINEQAVYKLTFSFQDQLGREYFVEEKTHKTYLLEDDELERLLYLEEQPQLAVMIDTLPSSPKIDSQGNLAVVSFFSCIRCLLIPALTIVGHGSYFIFGVLN